AHAAAGPAADPLLPRPLVDAVVDGAEVHCLLRVRYTMRAAGLDPAVRPRQPAGSSPAARLAGTLHGHAAEAGHFLARAQLQQPLDGRLDQVDRVGAAVGLGKDVADAAGLQHVADARPGLDARARPGGDQDHAAAAEAADDAVRDRLAAH